VSGTASGDSLLRQRLIGGSGALMILSGVGTVTGVIGVGVGLGGLGLSVIKVLTRFE